MKRIVCTKCDTYVFITITGPTSVLVDYQSPSVSSTSSQCCYHWVIPLLVDY
jgi:hypothetical protein